MLIKGCTNLQLGSCCTSPPGQGQTSNPTEQHWKAIKHILRSIAGTVNFELMFTRSGSADSIGFSDADWAGDIDDRKSTSGYLFQVGGASISWKSKKQSCVALSGSQRQRPNIYL